MRVSYARYPEWGNYWWHRTERISNRRVTSTKLNFNLKVLPGGKTGHAYLLGGSTESLLDFKASRFYSKMVSQHNACTISKL